MKSHLEIFSSLQLIEDSSIYLLLGKYILEKTVVGCPWGTAAAVYPKQAESTNRQKVIDYKL